MEFRWPHPRRVTTGEEILARLDELAWMAFSAECQNRRILELLERPVSLHLHPQGVPVPVTLNPGQSVTYSYTEQDANGSDITPLVGTPIWSTPEGTIATVADNGDGTATVTAQAAGNSSVDLTVTFADGNSVSATDAVTVESNAVADPASVTLIAGAVQ